MDLFEALISRRSIRKYTQDNVSTEDINILLRAAMQAPSACNQQPWEFVIIRGTELRKSLAEALPNAKMTAQAPAVIAVCGNLAEEKAKGFWVQDCSAAIQNMLLAAHGRNLGAVWCGVHPVPERVEAVRKLLNLPEHIVTLGLVVLGHPDQDPGEVNRFRAERIHREKW